MKLEKVIDYLIKDGDVYIKHDKRFDEYSWGVNIDGYDLSLTVYKFKLIGRADQVKVVLELVHFPDEDTQYTLYNSDGPTGKPDEIIARLRYAGGLNGKC